MTYPGSHLTPSGVKEARKEEVQVINEMGVWEVISHPVGEKFISTRWVDINKGDFRVIPSTDLDLWVWELKKSVVLIEVTLLIGMNSMPQCHHFPR